MYPISARPVPDTGRSVLSLASSSSDSSSAGSSPTSSSCCPSWQPFAGEDQLSSSRCFFGVFTFPQNPSLAQEMERLFIVEPRNVSVTDSCELEHDVEEFNSNGVSTELDELDYMVTKSRPTRAEMLGIGIVRNCVPVDDTEPLTKEGLLALITRRRKTTRGSKRGAVCVFCRNNGESEFIYLSHNLKDSSGRVTCPVLRAYTCPNCGANGDNAHTIKYCPLSTGESLNIRSLKTARTATGKKRAPLALTPLPLP